eukprot:TRINITY_DN3380_c0_g1_i3.p2 TRINITY_DN3380_c0_g1~~TRINITY_DN3380_c0_g1_i3.p2  ORF type:complete len:595 (+),score=218.12 TRINITY_DN3380_c0_g1_i3:64-1785(+)
MRAAAAAAQAGAALRRAAPRCRPRRFTGPPHSPAPGDQPPPGPPGAEAPGAPGGWGLHPPPPAPPTDGQWAGFGVSARHSSGAPVGAFVAGDGAAYKRSERQRMFKYQTHWEAEHPRVPLTDPDTKRHEEQAEKQAARDLRDATEFPHRLEPYFPEESEIVTTGAQGLDWELLHGKERKEAPARGRRRRARASSAAAPDAHPDAAAGAAADAPAAAAAGATTQQRKRRRRRWLHEIKYQRFARAVRELREMREQRRVRKLRRVVAAGLATEHDYYKEIRRLGLDPAQCPLGFVPQAYRRAQGDATLRGYLNEEAGSAGDTAETPASGAHFAALEDVLGRDTALRDEWLDIQEVVGRVVHDCKRMGQGDWAALRDPLHFERLRNLLARAAQFRARAGCAALAEHSRAVLNSSAHGLLHRSLFSADMVPAEEELADPAALRAALGVLSYDDFWAAADARAEARRRELRQTGSTAPKAARPAAAAAQPRSRSEWYKAQEQGGGWRAMQGQLADLRRRERAARLAAAPEYELVLSPGDMGRDGASGARGAGEGAPARKALSLHPAARAPRVGEETAL